MNTMHLYKGFNKEQSFESWLSSLPVLSTVRINPKFSHETLGGARHRF